MKYWRDVFRDGLAPLLSDKHLEILEEGLREDDPNLVQGATTTPPPLRCLSDLPVEAACLLGYCGWQGDGLETVAEVEEFFMHICFEIDQNIGEKGACTLLIIYFDETPREEMRREILAEVQRELKRRAAE